MNPALIEFLQAVDAKARAAGHGAKQVIYQQAAEELKISVSTLHRKIGTIVMRQPRKKRSDAGKIELSFAEAVVISAWIMEHHRKNEKRIISIEDALEELRASKKVNAERIDKNTGETSPLSAATVGRALHHYHLHPEQLKRPTPKTALASKHPNHVWQIDPSLCVLYYLPSKKGMALQVMEKEKFYKNKPANIRSIENERVWRYVITDHASGTIYVHYVLGAESGKNLVEAFIGATQKRHKNDPFCGIPKMVMVDPGSANTGAVFRNLCYALGIDLQINRPGQPWAKGQVEKANDIVERSFEHRLKAQLNPPTSLEELNHQGWQWMRWFNAVRVLRRTQKTRYATWLMISQEQLVFAPAPDVMKEISTHGPVERTVDNYMNISYQAKTYCVSDIPEVCVGSKIKVTRNPWRDDVAMVIYTNDEGREVMHVIEPELTSDFGFSANAAVIGEEFKAKPDSVQDTNRKLVERVAMDADTDEEAAHKRKKKAVAFGGSVDPMKPITDTALPSYITKRGTDVDVQGPIIEEPNMHLVQVAKRLRSRMGNDWAPTHYQWLQQHYADGVTESELDEVEQRLRRRISSSLQAV